MESTQDQLGMDIDAATIRRLLEAVLLVSAEPVDVDAASASIHCTPDACKAQLEELSRQYDAESRGFQLVQTASGWQLVTRESCHDCIEEYLGRIDARKLSQAALEVLACVAYLQPIGREAIRSIRGVTSDAAINSLKARGIIKEIKSKPTPTGAAQYGTTKAFLEEFGLASLRDLPPIEQFAADEAAQRYIRERLEQTPLHLFDDDEPAAVSEEGFDVDAVHEDAVYEDIVEVDADASTAATETRA